MALFQYFRSKLYPLWQNAQQYTGRQMPKSAKNLAPLPVKLIFNPTSGTVEESPRQLLTIVSEMQAWNLLPEVFMVQPGCDLHSTLHDALHRGLRLFVVCGGDGTLDAVAGELIGRRATLGHIPTGTRNNVAASLSIPSDLRSAVALLRTGRRVKVDVGVVAGEESRRFFLENCSIGLLSALFPAADGLQHGNLARIGEFLSTLVSASPSEMHLLLDRTHKIDVKGHGVLINNMPFIGPRYQLGPAGAYNDGEFEVLVFADISKLALFTDAIQMAAQELEAARIQRYHARRLEIITRPSMPVLVDDAPLNAERVKVTLKKRALTMIAGDSSVQPEPVTADPALSQPVVAP